jgi:hypothetical protein
MSINDRGQSAHVRVVGEERRATRTAPSKSATASE